MLWLLNHGLVMLLVMSGSMSVALVRHVDGNMVSHVLLDVAETARADDADDTEGN